MCDDTCTGELCDVSTESEEEADTADDRDATDKAEAADEAEEGCRDCCRAAWVCSRSLALSLTPFPKIRGSPGEAALEGESAWALLMEAPLGKS